MASIIATPKDYWISPQALTITLNALGEPNRTQCSVSGGAAVLCYIKGVKPASEGGDPENGDGLEYDDGHNYRRWPLTISPTFFNSNTAKYLYVAIPRSASVGTDAVVVFPDEKLDIYGRIVLDDGEGEQVGSEDYFYIWLQGIISSSGDSGHTPRHWEQLVDTGKLSTDEAISTLDTDWYKYSTTDGIVHFLKEIAMDEGSKFLNLIADFADIKNLNAENITFSNILKSLGASKGFLDGKGIYMDALEGLIQTDGLEVRGFMRVMELIINRLQLMESDYSFTEGADVEHIDYLSDGRLKLWIHKKHDNDYLPFYYGDILYAKVNNLLPRGAAVPDGHTPTKSGSYYTVWMSVDDMDFGDNTITVSLFRGKKPDGSSLVPGSHNFTPYGTSIYDFGDDPVAAVNSERGILRDVALANNVVTDVPGATLGEGGFDTHITLTRHGNLADSSDPHIKQSQLGRQQSWVLSTTDQRITYYWHVDEPFYRSDNIALCLGILPTMLDDDGILPSTRDKSMPSLYINTVFYENIHHINYPSRIVKEDRGEWVSPSQQQRRPSVAYGGPGGTWVPDGTLDDIIADTTLPENRRRSETIEMIKSLAGTYATGDTIWEPYHNESFTAVEWLTSRLSPAWSRLSDADLYRKMLVEWHHDLETSRAWTGGKLWECLHDNTTQEPYIGCTDWVEISGDMTWWIDFQSSNGSSFYQGHVSTVVTARVWWGSDDVTDRVGASAFKWTRSSESGKTAADEAWDAMAAHSGTNVLHLTDDDMPTAWSRNNKAIFTCTVTYDGQTVAENRVIA